MEIKKSGTAKGAEGGFKLPEARREVKKRKRKKLVTAFIIAVPIVLTAVWLLFDKLFVIRHFEMTGNGEYSVRNPADPTGFSVVYCHWAVMRPHSE